MNSSQKNILLELYKSNNTVFPLRRIVMQMADIDVSNISKSMNYYVRTGKILNPRRGIYAKPGYKQEELAGVLYTPSYISLEYVLQRAGVVFQYDSSITLVSYLNRKIDISGNEYKYRKIKGEILTNTAGILNNDLFHIATPERAFLDMVYLDPHYYFDNIEVLNLSKIKELLPIYGNVKMEQRVTKLLKDNGYK